MDKNNATHFLNSIAFCFIEMFTNSAILRWGFECVVKRLRMALYRPDSGSNDCELPSGQATPSRSSAILKLERLVADLEKFKGGFQLAKIIIN